MDLQQFFSGSDLIPLASPVNLATAANPGDRINMTNYESVVLVLVKAIGTAGEDPVITPLQHDAATSGNSKAVNISTVYSRLSATDVGAVGAWTKVTQNAGPTYTDDTSAEKQGMIAVEIKAEELDAVNGYKYISLNIPDTGTNSQLGATFAILRGKRYQGAEIDVTV